MLNEHGVAYYEPLSMACFLAAAESKPGVVFDIGANIGIYALMAASGLRTQVVAVEPFEKASEVLKLIAQKYNLPIKVIDAAVSDVSGVAELYISKQTDMSNSLNPSFRKYSTTIGVVKTTIDHLSSRFKPSAIKIDVETHEEAALAGAKETIKRDRPVILIEALNDSVTTLLESFANENHYHTLKMGDPAFTGRFDLNDSHPSGETRNWLLLPEEPSERFFRRAGEWLAFNQKL